MKKTTSDFFVSYKYGDGINDIFTTRKESEKENDKRNDSYQRSFFSDGKRPYKVVTLYDAIDSQEEYIRERTELNNSNDEPLY